LLSNDDTLYTGKSRLYGEKGMEEQDKQKILFVDDEPNVLNAFKRQFRNDYDIDIALGGETALKYIEENGPYAVMVTDMNMPVMDGIELLKRVNALAPDTVRMMLTGYADMRIALTALNQGNIYRFLTKPCTVDELAEVVKDGLRQYRLVTAEKELLQKTLTGSVKILTDIIAMMDQASFGAALKARPLIRELCKLLDVDNSWDVELAGMLSRIGMVAVPSSVKEKLNQGKKLEAEERGMLDRVPEVSSQLLAQIPRLGRVASIVKYHQKDFSGGGVPHGTPMGNDIPFGARILRVVNDFKELESKEKSSAGDLIAVMQKHSDLYDPVVLKAFSALFNESRQKEVGVEAFKGIEVTLEELLPGHMVLADIVTRQNTLLISRGHILTQLSVERIKNYAKLAGIKVPILVDSRTPLV